MSPGKARQRRRAARVAASAGLAWVGCAPADAPADDPALLTIASSPGYPDATSRLTLRLEGDLQKLCHATLVSPDWALTAAHCFAGVDPSARGALNDFARNLGASDVVFHPEALKRGVTRLEQVLEESDFVAAHDLALIPVVPALDDVTPVPHWLPVATCTVADSLDVRARFGKLGPNGEAQTAEATLLGTVAAASLLGSGQPGSLLSAQGPSVGPGDSGSGVASSYRQIEALASGCARSGRAGDDEVLMGVIQDANPERTTEPFGLIPLYPFEHSEWLTAVIQATLPRSEPERPRLYP